MTQVQLTVQGMTCEGCAVQVADALRGVDGVTDADVNYRAGTARVELSTSISDTALSDAVARAGYRAEVLRPRSTKSASRSTRTREVPSLTIDEGGSAGAAYDLFVIGTGGAGVAAAIQGAMLNARVAIAESGTLGGTCVNVGCIPSKNLVEAAAHLHAVRKGFPGIAGCAAPFDWSEVLRQKNDLVTGLRAAKYQDVLASHPMITRIEGPARLLHDGRVRVGETEYRAGKIVLATGTSPALAPIPGLAEAQPLDSSSVMELDQLPESLIVLGGSAVGLELGQIFARFGVKVTILEIASRLLPAEDEAISLALAGYFREEGIEIHTGAVTTAVERDDSGVVVHVRLGDLEGTLRAAEILVATGRRANTRDLGLKEAGVELTDRGFVRVDSGMRTTNPNVFAAGDVTGGPGFVYVAAAGGRVAAENALSSDQRELDLSVVPNVTFTSPQVASVGMTENAARAAGYHVELSTLAMEHVPRALVSQDTRGLVRIVAESGSGRVVGVHAIGPHAGELMGEATLAVRFGLTTRDLTSTLHPYLTWIESLRLAAQGFGSDVSKLSCCA